MFDEIVQQSGCLIFAISFGAKNIARQFDQE